MRHLKLATFVASGLALASYGSCNGPATAADLAPPVYRAPPVIAPSFNWTGFYIGGNIGAGSGTNDYEQSIPLAGIGAALGAPVTLPTVAPDGSHTVNGFLGGGQVGYNFQMGTDRLGCRSSGRGRGYQRKGQLWSRCVV